MRRRNSRFIDQTAGRICSEWPCAVRREPDFAPVSGLAEPILKYIHYAKEKGCLMTGPEDEQIERLNVWKGEANSLPSEMQTPDVKMSIRVNRQLYSGKSEFQRIDVL